MLGIHKVASVSRCMIVPESQAPERVDNDTVRLSF